jgi:sulfatase maturation enzyme AslB (radical SAM superfamily)
MTWRTLRAAVDWLFAAPADHLRLGFTGGEPLLEIALLRRAVARAERLRPPGLPIEYGVTTNGLLLDPSAARFLERHRFRVQLSFDGVPRAQELRARGSFAALDALLVRLRREHAWLFEHGLSVAITVPPEAVPCLADSVAYFLDRGVRRLLIAPTMGLAGGEGASAIRRLAREFERVERICWTRFEATGAAPLVFFGRALWAGRPREEPTRGPRARRRIGRPMCRMGQLSQLTVDVDGTLSECVLLARSVANPGTARTPFPLAPLVLGSIHDDDLDARATAYRAALSATGLFGDRRDKHSSFGRCADCRHLDDCAVCPMAVAMAPGNADPHRIPDYQCAFYRIALEQRERFRRRVARATSSGGGPFIPLALRRLGGALTAIRA